MVLFKMQQPKDYAETIQDDDVVIDFTHRQIIYLRVATGVVFFLGILVGALVF
jgi:dihydrodipicolinate reductase